MSSKTSTVTLPISVSADKNVKNSVQTQFGGIRTEEAASGADMVRGENFTSSNFPRLSTAHQKRFVSARVTQGAQREVVAADKIYVIEAAGIYVSENGRRTRCATLLQDSKKNVTVCGRDLFVLPDHIYYDGTSEEKKNMRESTEEILVTLKGKTLTTDRADLVEFGLRRGDGIIIATSPSGVTPYMFRGNYRVDTVSESTLNVDTDFPYTGTCIVTITRDMPLLDIAMSLGERVFGARGVMVYISEAGNINNWNASSGLDSDPASLISVTYGDFTACAEWNGYPIFFKEGAICKLMGNKASNYSLIETSAPGIPKWAAKTLVSVGGALYYCNATGVYKYDGGYPRRIDIGAIAEGIRGTSAATDGEKYYLYGDGVLYVYDPRRDIWYTASCGSIVSMSGRQGEVYMLEQAGNLFGFGNTVIGSEEYALPSEARFGYDDCGTADKKSLLSLSFSYIAAMGTQFQVYVEFDEDGVEHLLAQYQGDGKWHTATCTCPSNRCNGFRISLSIIGNVTLASITRKYRVIV